MHTLSREIKKHVATIHCANELSLLQRKVSNALLYHAYPNLLEQDEHKITVGQLCKIIGYSGNNYAVIKNALRGLVTTVIEWNILDEKIKGENWTASTLLASVNMTGAICSYAYSPRLKHLLLSPVIYGTINLIIQARFKSSYGLALYENCARFKELSSTGWFELHTFRKLMGVAIGQYKVFRDLKRRIIDKAVDEVNTYSDIQVEPEFKYIGRQVSAIRFKLKTSVKKITSSPKSRPEDELSPTQQVIKTELRDSFGLTNTQIQTLFRDFRAEYIHEKMQLIKNSTPFQSGQIRNLAGYLQKALKDDYQTPVSAMPVPNTPSQQTAAFEKLAAITEEQELRKKYAVYMKQYWENLFNHWDRNEREHTISLFIRQLEQQNEYLTLKMYRQHDVHHPVVKSALYAFLEKHALLKDKLQSFATYCQQLEKENK